MSQPEHGRPTDRAAERSIPATQPGQTATESEALGVPDGPGAVRKYLAGMDPASAQRLMIVLQRYAGNTAVTGELRRDPRPGGPGGPSGPGEPLGAAHASALSSAFGSNLSAVRVHTGPGAQQAADAAGARAVTYGQDIAFASGEYQPGTEAGDALIAHEVAHAVQQAGGAQPAGSQPAEADLEHDANRSASSVIGSLWQRARTDLAGAAETAVPRLRSGLQLRACSKPKKSPADIASGTTIANATKVSGDSYVALLNGPPVTITTPLSPEDAGSVTWTGGQAGASAAERIVPTGAAGKFDISASGGGSSKTISVYVVDATTLPVSTPATLNHILSGVSNPGANFGLTVVTIGQQGVVGPELDITAHLNGGQWGFRVKEIRHRYKVGINSQGRTNVSGPGDAAITPATIGAIVTDLTPPAAGATHGPPRTTYWNQTITRAHEEAHVTHFYTFAAFWPNAMQAFQTEVEAMTVAFDPADPNTLTAAAVIAAQKPTWQTKADTHHQAADAAEIAGSEAYAHGVSNPMYTALITSIKDTVVPPAPTALTATATAPDSTSLSWNFSHANETGFVIQRRHGTGGWTNAGNAAVGATTFSESGLTAQTHYSYRVAATGAAGNSAFAGPVNVTTPK
jgi:hypothetical protein